MSVRVREWSYAEAVPPSRGVCMCVTLSLVPSPPRRSRRSPRVSRPASPSGGSAGNGPGAARPRRSGSLRSASARSPPPRWHGAFQGAGASVPDCHRGSRQLPKALPLGDAPRGDQVLLATAASNVPAPHCS